MYARLVSEGIGAYDRLIVGGRLADNVINQLAGTVDLLGINTGQLAVEVGAGVHSHNNLFQGGVTCTLAKAVYGTLNL